MTRSLLLVAVLLMSHSSLGQSAAPGSSEAVGPPAASLALPLNDLIRSVVTRVGPTVVKVWTTGEGGDNLISGTLITENGLVLTCAHIDAEVGGTATVELSDARRVRADVIAKLPAKGERRAGKDLALLRLAEPGPWPAARLAPAAPTAIGEPVLAMGFPDTMIFGDDRDKAPLYVRFGRTIDGIFTQSPGELLTSIHGVGGDSGGPLFDLGGRLLGVVHAGDSSGAHVNYTRIDVLLSNWDRLASGSPLPSLDAAAPPPDAHIDSQLEALVARARSYVPSVVEVSSDHHWVALGCIVDDGYVLTKASDLGERLTVRTHDDYVAIAEIAATDPDLDLALLRLPYAPELISKATSISFENDPPAVPGALLALATPAFLAPLTGVVSVTARPVPGLLGCIPGEFEDAGDVKGVRVGRIIEDLRAYRLRKPPLPLRVGDVITAIEGKPVTDLASYRALMFGRSHVGTHPIVSGERVAVRFTRAEEAMDATVTLEFGNTPSGQLVRPVSTRYSGYPAAFVTDLPTRPEHAGAPVLDAQGRIAGIVIARAPFIETLVIPAPDVQACLLKLKAATATE